MWIDNKLPPKRGYYKTLVDTGEGLQEFESELFNGVDWCVYESSAQFIRYWWDGK